MFKDCNDVKAVSTFTCNVVLTVTTSLSHGGNL